MLYKFVELTGSSSSASANAFSASSSLPALAAASARRDNSRILPRSISTGLVAGRVDGCGGKIGGADHTSAAGPIATRRKMPRIARIKWRVLTSNNSQLRWYLFRESEEPCANVAQADLSKYLTRRRSAGNILKDRYFRGGY